MRLKITDKEARELGISGENIDFVNSLLFVEAYIGLTSEAKSGRQEEQSMATVLRPTSQSWSPSQQRDIDRTNGKYDGVLG